MTGVPYVLLVDDEPDNIDILQQVLGDLDATTKTASSGEQALSVLSHLSGPHGFPGVVVSDMKMPVMDGLDLLQRTRAIDSELPLIVVTAYGDVKSAVKAMQGGAYDFIERPYDLDRLQEKVARALESRRLVLENRELKAELANRPGMAAKLIGNSPAIQTLREEIANLAGTDASVLIHGETGSGKEVVARCLHEFGRRKSAHFVAVNCGAIPENIFESELFGYEAGAFTGAVKRSIGKFEFARGGTVFLDEIESMSLQHQVKVLRVLDDQEINRLGSSEPIRVNFRVVAATKTDLQTATKEGAFREDLYYRLNVAALRIPPLRDRREDIPLLFEHFAQERATLHRRALPELSQGDLQALFAHEWPGNVRELRNIVERFVLGLGEIGQLLNSQQQEVQTLPDQVAGFESAVIARALADNGGRVQGTADALGIPQRTLNEKMRKYGLDRKDFQ